LTLLERLLSDYWQEILEQRRTINILRNKLAESDQTVQEFTQQLEQTKQEKDEKISNLKALIRREKEINRNQKRELDNLNISYQTITAENQGLQAKIAAKNNQLNRAQTEIEKLKNDLRDYQNASTSSEKSRNDDPNEIARKFLDLHGEEWKRQWKALEDY